jgi:hypothetical protein
VASILILSLVYTSTMINVEQDPGRTTNFGSNDSKKRMADVYKQNEWNHIACQYSENGNQCYVNGEAVDSDADVLNVHTRVFNSTDSSDYTISYWTRYNGTVDNIMVFNLSLPEKNIVALYHLDQ